MSQGTFWCTMVLMTGLLITAGTVILSQEFEKRTLSKKDSSYVPRNEESQLQRACVNWFRYRYPQKKWLLYAVPNGGHRHVSTARALKAEGVLAGVADLFLSIPNKTFHGLYIEMKVGYNKQTDSQKKFEAEVTQVGYAYEVCYSFDQFENIITQYLNDTYTKETPDQ